MKKCVVFYGGDSQTGTTMVAVSAAELLAGTGKRILLIGASSHPVDLWLPRSAASSLDDLYPALKEGTLTADEIRRTVMTARGVDILSGTGSGYGGKFGTGDLETVCSLIREDYDWILVDGGCGPADGLTMAALQCGQKAILVLTQQEKCLQRFEAKISGLERVLPPEQLYVVNKFNDSGAFYTEKELAERLGCGSGTVETIAFVPFGWQAEMDRVPLLNHRKFRRDMEKVTGWIEEDEGFEDRRTGRTIRRILSALPHGRDSV